MDDKFAIARSEQIPTHLKYFATLPCKALLSRN